jgi:hypothetical protein
LGAPAYACAIAAGSSLARFIGPMGDDQLDEAQLAAWVKQAAQLPGWGKA